MKVLCCQLMCVQEFFQSPQKLNILKTDSFENVYWSCKNEYISQGKSTNSKLGEVEFIKHWDFQAGLAERQLVKKIVDTGKRIVEIVDHGIQAE